MPSSLRCICSVWTQDSLYIHATKPDLLSSRWPTFQFKTVLSSRVINGIMELIKFGFPLNHRLYPLVVVVFGYQAWLTERHIPILFPWVKMIRQNSISLVCSTIWLDISWTFMLFLFSLGTSVDDGCSSLPPYLTHRNRVSLRHLQVFVAKRPFWKTRRHVEWSLKPKIELG